MQELWFCEDDLYNPNLSMMKALRRVKTVRDALGLITVSVTQYGLDLNLSSSVISVGQWKKPCCLLKTMQQIGKNKPPFFFSSVECQENLDVNCCLEPGRCVPLICERWHSISFKIFWFGSGWVSMKGKELRSVYLAALLSIKEQEAVYFSCILHYIPSEPSPMDLTSVEKSRSRSR